MKRFGSVGWGIVALLIALPARGQEADVEAAVRGTLDAWRTGEYAAFVGSYHPDARGFFLDGGDVIAGFSLEALEATAEAGFQADVTLRDLDVAVYGDAAVSVGLLEGALTLPGGFRMEGVWRYSETRVRDGSEWTIVQFHISPQQGTGLD
jgi:ketosteroid isomerase-like protein